MENFRNQYIVRNFIFHNYYHFFNRLRSKACEVHAELPAGGRHRRRGALRGTLQPLSHGEGGKTSCSSLENHSLSTRGKSAD